MPRKGQIVFADTAYATGKAFPMRIPTTQQNAGSQVRTLGGLMCLDLFAIVVSDVQISLQPVRDAGLRPIVCIDSGSEGYFLQDDIGGHVPGFPSPGIPSVSELIAREGVSWDAGTGHYGVIIGEDKEHTFSLLVSAKTQAWKLQKYGNLLAQPPERPTAPYHPKGAAHYRSQLLIIGNMFLDNIAITYNCGTKHIYLSNVDSKGARFVRDSTTNDFEYADRRLSLPAFMEVHSLWKQIEQKSKPQHRPRSGYSTTALRTSYVGPHLLEEIIPFRPRADDNCQQNVCVPLNFLVDSTSLLIATTASEAITDKSHRGNYSINDTSFLIYQPAIQLYIEGPTGHVNMEEPTYFVLDSGSGVSFLLIDMEKGPTHAAFDEVSTINSACLGPRNAETLQPLSVSDFFANTVVTHETPSLCGNDCVAPLTDGQRLNTKCCNRCCLGKHALDGSLLTESTPIECGISYCTGAIAYQPAFISAHVPHQYVTEEEASSNALLRCRPFVARGSIICNPIHFQGVLGCWFWTNKMRDTDLRAIDHAPFPFYILDEIGHSAPDDPLNNMTIIIWNTNIAKGEHNDAMIYGNSKEDMRAALSQAETEENELSQSVGVNRNYNMPSSSSMQAMSEKTLVQTIVGASVPPTAPPSTKGAQRKQVNAWHAHVHDGLPFTASDSPVPTPVSYTMPPSWSSFVPHMQAGHPIPGSNFITNVVSGRDTTSYNDESVEVLHEIRNMLSKDAARHSGGKLPADHPAAVPSTSPLIIATTGTHDNTIPTLAEDASQENTTSLESALNTMPSPPPPPGNYEIARTLLFIILTIGGIITLFIVFTRKRRSSLATTSVPIVTDSSIPAPLPAPVLPPLTSDPLSYDTSY